MASRAVNDVMVEKIFTASQTGATINIPDENQRSPLIVAATLQLTYFNKKTSLFSNYDSNVHDYVVEGLNDEQYSQATEIVNHLITSTSDVNIADKDGNTALHFAAQCDLTTVISLLNKCARIGLLNNSGETATPCSY